MARIRTIKPEFWTDGTMIGLSVWARLFYIGTWNFTLCDRGHLPDDPLGLKLRILPSDPVDADQLVNELLEARRLVRIHAEGGRTFLAIPRFGDHQKVDARWNSRCPACTLQDSPKLAGGLGSSGETRDGTAETRLGGEGKGKERKGGDAGEFAPTTPFCSAHPNGTERPCRACQSAREQYELHRRPKPKPTVSGIISDPDCLVHPGRPRIGCDRCAEERSTP